MLSNEIIKWHTHFRLIKQTCRNTYLMTFQFLHHIILTNTYLFKVKIKDNERCSFCKNEPESLEHLFFDCSIAKDFWNNLSRKLILYFREFDLNRTEIFIGSNRKDLFLNWLFIVAKNYIFKLAAKRVQLQSLIEIQNQQIEIDRIQSEYEKKIKEEKDKLELIKERKEVEIATAWVKVYEDEDSHHSSSGLERMVGEVLQDDMQRPVPSQELPANTEFKYNVNAASCEQKNSASELSKLMEIFREGISLNRLPTPEPIIFNGDPLQFHEWKNTFSALIGSKGISSTDKLYYLRKYTSRNAAKLIEGSFLQSDDTAFDDAWRN